MIIADSYLCNGVGQSEHSRDGQHTLDAGLALEVP